MSFDLRPTSHVTYYHYSVGNDNLIEVKLSNYYIYS